MKAKEFPTINQLKDAVQWNEGHNCEYVTYDSEKCVFTAQLWIPCPVYYEGEIDSCDFESVLAIYTFYQAYNVWKNHKDFELGILDIPDPVPPCPLKDEDYDLPF